MCSTFDVFLTNPHVTSCSVPQSLYSSIVQCHGNANPEVHYCDVMLLFTCFAQVQPHCLIKVPDADVIELNCALAWIV